MAQPFSPTAPEPLLPVVERVDHIGWAVSHMDTALPTIAWMGGRYRTGAHHHSDRFRWAQFDLEGDTSIEVLSPHDPGDADHFLVRFLTQRGEGFHHLTLKVFDLDHAVDAAQRAGYDVFRRNDSNPNWREAFLHPRSTGGILIQLAAFPDTTDTPVPSIEDILGPPP